MLHRCFWQRHQEPLRVGSSLGVCRSGDGPWCGLVQGGRTSFARRPPDPVYRRSGRCRRSGMGRTRQVDATCTMSASDGTSVRSSPWVSPPEPSRARPLPPRLRFRLQPSIGVRLPIANGSEVPVPSSTRTSTRCGREHSRGACSCEYPVREPLSCAPSLRILACAGPGELAGGACTGKGPFRRQEGARCRCTAT